MNCTEEEFRLRLCENINELFAYFSDGTDESIRPFLAMLIMLGFSDEEISYVEQILEFTRNDENASEEEKED